jgi:biotin carboxyl carrier protein
VTGRRAPGTPVQPVGRLLDSGAVRITTVGADLDGVAPIVVEPAGDGDRRGPRPLVDGVPEDASLELLGWGRATLRQGAPGSRHQVVLPTRESGTAGRRPGVDRREVIVDGWRIEVEVESATRAELRERASRGREQAGRSGPSEVHAIIPGVVVSVSVAPGDTVTAGQQLLVVEAMKMQNELRSPRDGTIERVAVGAGATIDVGDLLLVLA